MPTVRIMRTVTEVNAMTAHIQHPVRVLAAAMLWLVALVIWPADPALAAPVRVTAVTLQEATSGLQVSIATSGPAPYEQRTVRADWVVVDVLGAELGIPAGTVPVSGGVVSQVRVGQFTADVVRVVVELTQPAHVQLRASPDGAAIIVGIPGQAKRGSTPAVGARPSGGGGEIAKITGITIWGTPDKPWVTIIASGPVRYQLQHIQPDWVVVDVSKAQLALATPGSPIARGLVKQIRFGQFAPEVVRVVLVLTQAVPIHIATSAGRAAIIVSFAVKARPYRGSTQAQRVDGVLTASTQQPPTSPQHTASGLPVATSRPAIGPSSAPTVQSIAGLPPASGPQNTGRPSGDGYLLGPEDVLEITVWGYPDMTRVVPVRPDGKIAVPLAGTVPAAGRSVEQLTQDITRAFAKYIINPQVTLIVKEFRKIRVSVLGQVTHPGTYTLPPGGRILDAIAMASGVTDSAALPQAQLVRASGETRPLSLDGLLLQQDMRYNLVVEPGDTVLIPEDTKNKFYIIGDVNHAGIYPLKGDVTVLQALAIAGGPVLHGQSASTTAYIVRRVNPADAPFTASVRSQDVQQIANGNGVLITMDLQKMMHGDLRQNEALRPGDVMVVPAPGAAALPILLSIIQTILIPFRF
jgi:polysaccharide biosynthesis/export protein